ncbi:MAG: DNA polymerase III subunit delta' [Lachnospiraceae bacterium]
MAGFRNVLGHEQAVNSLQNAIMLGKVSHAYIINGEDGAGKKTLADAFAMTLQCEKGTKDACLECHSCKQAMTRNQPDIIYLKPEKENLISVSDIRQQINADVSIKPYSSRYKIYIINHAERMNEAAQNAILKTIEEPPEYVIILLLTTNAQMLLPTIRSRCITIEVRPVADEIVKDYLMKTLSVPEDEAAICTAFAQGNVGKAARLSGSEDFNHIRNEAVQLLKRIKNIDLYELVQAVKVIGEYKLEVDDYFDILSIWYRDVLVYKATMDANKLVFQDEIYDIKKQAATSSYEGIERILKAIETAKTRVKANVNLELTLELLLLNIKEN